MSPSPDVDLTFGGKVKNIPMKEEEGMQLVQHWIDTMLSSFVAAFAERRIKNMPTEIVDQFGHCNKKATNVPKQARCVSRLLRNQFTAEKSLKTRAKGRSNQPKKSRKLSSREKSSSSAFTTTYMENWKETIGKIRKNASERKEKRKWLEGEKSVERMEQLVFRGLSRRGIIKEDLPSIFNDPSKLKRWLNEKRKSMKPKDPMEKLLGLFRQGLKLGHSLAGENVTDFDDKTLKVVSPRFLSVVPEEDHSTNDTVNLMSPSLFSLHNKGKDIEDLTSLPNLMKNFTREDQEKWLDLIMEASGVVEQAEKLTDYKKVEDMDDFRKQYERENRMKDGTPLYFTRDNVTEIYGEDEQRRIDVHVDLSQSLSKEQIKELNRTGYVVMTPAQLDLLYGPKSPYSDEHALGRFAHLNSSNLEEHLERDVHHAATFRSVKVRQKREAVLSVNSPFILSPFVFSPLILSPAILGPLILSPVIFTPVILSPRLMTPVVLSPFAFVPFVLSPLALYPVILGPGIFIPLILSPMVLSPFILSPQVFTPIILSPLALSPFILNPTVGSPLILSPYVLTPILYSPQILGALVLSPYALSPVVESKLIAYSVILSPSWLS
ncbi:moulting cycle domain-containing protein [Ditylenchus destructor]|uniref:Moulting cycle domain-containing protein n=1 Tax=Ditylenchus destructor TaxID=166010 RepID=A0AAD4MRK1_9BILA|nr:moulting cycle domain-containing protein [Ditylenchus destructor]